MARVSSLCTELSSSQSDLDCSSQSDVQWIPDFCDEDDSAGDFCETKDPCFDFNKKKDPCFDFGKKKKDPCFDLSIKKDPCFDFCEVKDPCFDLTDFCDVNDPCFDVCEDKNPCFDVSDVRDPCIKDPCFDPCETAKAGPSSIKKTEECPKEDDSADVCATDVPKEEQCKKVTLEGVSKERIRTAELRMKDAYKKYGHDWVSKPKNKSREQLVVTRDLLLHYIKYRLDNAGFDINGHEEEGLRKLFRYVGYLTISAPGRILEDFGNKIDSDHTNRMFLERPIRALGVSHRNARAHYFSWLNELFKDKKITWGRLALALVFTARLAQKAMEVEKCECVPKIVKWCNQYFVYNNFEEWITASGGWMALPPVDDEKTLSLLSRMPSILTITGTTMALIASCTLGFLMTR